MTGGRDIRTRTDNVPEDSAQAAPDRCHGGPRSRYLAVAGLIILLLAAVGLALVLKFLSSRPLDLRENVARMDALIDAEIQQAVWDVRKVEETRQQVEDRQMVWAHVTGSYRLPPAAESGSQLMEALRSALVREEAELRVLHEDRQNIVVSVTLAGVETHNLTFIKTPVVRSETALAETAGPTDAEAEIAVIVDDLGYGGEATDLLLSLDEPLTVSVLPKLPGSERAAQRARDAGFEVILHLPMEAEDDDAPQPGELRAGMSRDDIVQLIEEDLATVPGAVGVNNHRGSKVTKMEREMIAVMSTVGEHDLYFVDSLTTPESVALDVARRLGLESIGNDLFLDNDEDPASIRERFDDLMRIARRRGFSVGICHAKLATVEVLYEMLPTIRARGFRLVRVSELLDKDAHRHARAGD